MEFFDVAKSMEKEATFQITFLRHDFKTEATKPNPNSSFLKVSSLKTTGTNGNLIQYCS